MTKNSPHPDAADGENNSDALSQQLWVYAGLPILVSGTIGHVLSLLVLLGSRRMRSLSLSVYLVASAISGLAALHVGLLRQILLRLNGYRADVREETSDAGCRVHAALTYFSLQVFSWLQASVAVERVIAVWRPVQYKRWCTWKRNLIVVSAITVALAAMSILVIDSFALDESGRCTPWKRFLFDDVWGSLDLVLFALAPISVMVPCNVATMIQIFRKEEYKRRMNAAAAIGRHRYRQLTIMLLASNILCVLTTLPISVIFLVPGWTKKLESTYDVDRLNEWTIFSLLQYLGTMLGFTVYSLLARRFRQATSDLFCKGFNAKVSLLDSTTSSLPNRRQSPSTDSGRTALRLCNPSGINSGSLLPGKAGRATIALKSAAGAEKM